MASIPVTVSAPDLSGASPAQRINDNTVVLNPSAATASITSGSNTLSGTNSGYFPSNICYPNTVTNFPPFTISDGTGNELLRLDQNGELRVSKILGEGKSETDEHSHVLQGFFHIEAARIVGGFRCLECGEVIVEKVLMKIPKRAKKAKCLPRILKKV